MFVIYQSIIRYCWTA